MISIPAYGIADRFLSYYMAGKQSCQRPDWPCPLPRPCRYDAGYDAVREATVWKLRTGFVRGQSHPATNLSSPEKSFWNGFNPGKTCAIILSLTVAEREKSEEALKLGRLLALL
jgi:hypothetical protein